MLWYLGMVIFDSIPLAMLSMLLGAVTTVDNERALLEIVADRAAHRRAAPQSRWLALLSGVAAGVTLFFSLDIGLYSVGGGVLALIGFALLTTRQRESRSVRCRCSRSRRRRSPSAPRRSSSTSAMRGALGAFVETSFVAIPRIIDAVWSLPFPDLDHDVPQQPQPAHARRLRPLREVPLHPQSARRSASR